MPEGIRRVLSNLPQAAALLCAALLAIPAIQPFLTDQLTQGYDNVLHLWRALETDSLLRHGILYSRWQPHMAFGFGYPLLLFNPPLSALLASLLHRLGLEWTAAINGVFALGTMCSAVTMWLATRDIWGDGAGLIAAALVASLPFHAYVNYHRASASEALAWAFPGLILWGVLRWQRHGQRRGLLASAGGLAAMLLTHDASAYLFLPFPAILVATLALANRSAKELGRGMLALALGVGLAAFFWLPSILERPYVQFERVLEYPYTASFVALDQLLEPPRAVDPTQVNQGLPKGIGLLPALMALASLLACLKAPTRQQRFLLAGVLACTVGYVWLASPFARPVWRLVPCLAYLHFPWRFLTPAAFGVAILGGAGVGWAAGKAPAAVPLAMATLALGSLGWLYPPHSSLTGPASLPGMLAYERTTGWIGGTTFGELLPTWADKWPEERTPEDDISAGREPARLRPESLPEGSRILSADYAPLEATVLLEASAPFRARYLAFYYPGWRVSVDGEPVAVFPAAPDGLMSFDVPAGHHTIHVRFGETPLRLAADAASLLSLAALALFLLLPTSSRGTQITEHESRVTEHESRVTEHESRNTEHAPRIVHSPWFLLAIAVLIVAVKLAVIDRLETPLRRANLVDGRLRDVDVPAEITFGDEFVLLGYDALPARTPGHAAFEVQTYWRALHPGGGDYGVTVNVVDGQGYRWNAADVRPPRWHRTPPPVGEWPPDQYALIALSVPLLPGTPPGSYTVEVVAFDHGTLIPLTAHDAGGRALGPALPLGQVTVSAPRTPASLEELDIGQCLDAGLGPLTLLGVDFDRTQAAPGDPVLVTTFWRADQRPIEDLAVHLALLALDGSTAAEYDFPPSGSWHPTSVWKAGDAWRGQHLIHLPAGLESGHYTWQLSMEPTRQSLALPADIQISAPSRTFTAPPLQRSVNLTLGDLATLVGFDLDAETVRPGDTLTVTLAWRSKAETRTSYHVFLHLVAPDGTLAAQSDGIPAGWTRPTTGWLPGEVVTDVRTLAIPPGTPVGDYALFTGLYDPDGARLPAPDGTSAIPIATVTIPSFRTE